MSTYLFPKQIVIDGFIFVAVCLPLFLLHTFGKPVVTGFWCNDVSLSLPYKSDTIPQTLLLTLSLGVPFLVMAVTESIRAAVNSQMSLKFRAEMMSLVKAYGLFLFGMAVNSIFLDVLKLSAGRLRPHFFDVCRPEPRKINCTTDPGIRRFFNKNANRPATYPTDDKTNALLETPDMCKDVSVFDALLIVHSAVTHFEHRQKYRDTYGSIDFTSPYQLKIIFFMGLPADPGLQEEILQENIQEGDTVQGNFTDTYRNLTYKAVMAYRWVSQNCKGAKVILKMDDDVILDVHRFFEEFVLPPIYQQDLIYCHVWAYGEVERIGKWGVSELEYKDDFYPPYCSGFIVVIMPAIVDDLYETAKETPFLWLDDVYIYGVVRAEMHEIQLVNLDEVAYREEHYETCYRQYGYRFVLEYDCTNSHIDQKWVKDSHLSFPSGHASLATYSAAFIIFYMQMRMNVKFSHLLRPVLQMCMVILALYCCVTRVTDHKHFTTDVIAGSILGVSLAWIVFYKTAYPVIGSLPTEKPPRLARSNSVESEPQTPTPLLRPERIVIDHSYKNNIPPAGSKGSFVDNV